MIVLMSVMYYTTFSFTGTFFTCGNVSNNCCRRRRSTVVFAVKGSNALETDVKLLAKKTTLECDVKALPKQSPQKLCLLGHDCYMSVTLNSVASIIIIVIMNQLNNLWVRFF